MTTKTEGVNKDTVRRRVGATELRRLIIPAKNARKVLLQQLVSKSRTALKDAGMSIIENDFVEPIVISGKVGELYEVTSFGPRHVIGNGGLRYLPEINIRVPIVEQRTVNSKRTTLNHSLSFPVYAFRLKMAGRYAVRAIYKLQHLRTERRASKKVA